jgi:hypothetical protein
MTRKKTQNKDVLPEVIDGRQKVSKKDQICHIIKKTKDKFLTQGQRKYYDTLKHNQITIC